MDIFDKEKTVISCFDLTGNMVRPGRKRDTSATASIYSIRREKRGRETSSMSARICATGCLRSALSPLRPFSLPVRMWLFPGQGGSRTRACSPCSSPYACSMPPSTSRNGHMRRTSSKTPFPPSPPTGASRITPSIPVITRAIRVVKTTCTPKKPASGQGEASSCRRQTS